MSLESSLYEALRELGVDFSDPNFCRTHERWAGWLREFSGNDATPEDILSPVYSEEHHELVVLKDINFIALCAHHVLPFYGKVHVGYIPNEKGEVVGLSKIPRIVRLFSRRLTLQERMTTQIADSIYETLYARGVMVVVTAEHMCMRIRGICDPTVVTTTSAVRGAFAKNSGGCKDEFLSLIK